MFVTSPMTSFDSSGQKPEQELGDPLRSHHKATHDRTCNVHVPAGTSEISVYNDNISNF